MAKGSKLFSLADALTTTSSLLVLRLAGLGAIVARDRRLILLDQRTRITDSLNLEAALAATGHSGKKWDYLLSVGDTRKVVALEPHTASDTDIAAVIQKRREARLFLTRHFRTGSAVHRWLWVSHGPCSFSNNERARRQLDQHGIEYVGRLVRNLD